MKNEDDLEEIESNPIFDLPPEERAFTPKYYQLVKVLLDYLNRQKYYFNGTNYNTSLYPCIPNAIRHYNYIKGKGKFLADLKRSCQNKFNTIKYENCNQMRIPQEIRIIINQMKKHFGGIDLKVISKDLRDIADIIESGYKQHLADSFIKKRILSCKPDYSSEFAGFMVSMCNNYSISKIKDAIFLISQENKSLDSDSIENDYTNKGDVNSCSIIFTKSFTTVLETIDNIIDNIETVYNNNLSTPEREIIRIWASYHFANYLKLYNDDPLVLPVLKKLKNSSFFDSSIYESYENIKKPKITNKFIAKQVGKSEPYISRTLKKFRKDIIELKIQL